MLWGGGVDIASIVRCEPMELPMQTLNDLSRSLIALAAPASTSNRLLGLAVMGPLSEDKLVSFLAEIQSDIRQIKSDLQALLMLLKQQEKATNPGSFSDGDHMAEPAESGQSASPEDVLRYLRETRGEDQE
jgi:hypothetical protein